MTVPSQTPKVTHTANGTSKSFAFTFRIRKTSHLAVYVDSTLQTLGTHYSVTSTNLSAGGSVVFVNAPANGAKVRIYRNMPYSRTDFDYQTSGSFPAATINEDLDSLALQVQQIADAVNRAVNVGLFSEGVSTSLPSPSSLKALRWNAAANALENFEPSSGSNTISVPVTRVERQTAADGQTVFNLTNSYLPGVNSIQVEMNNAILTSDVDYSETSTTSITLTDPAYAGDSLVFKTNAFVNSPASDAASVSFTQAGAGSVARNVSDVLKQRIYAKDKGAVPGTDATTALQNAINSLQPYQVFDLGGDFIISSGLTVPVDNVEIVNGKLTAAAGTSFEYMIYGTGRTGVKLRDLKLDANKANRVSGQNIRYMGAGMINASQCVYDNVDVVNCLGYSGTPAVGLVFGGVSAKCKAIKCDVSDCGDNSGSKGSDGIYASGYQNLIGMCTAKNCTDTAFVIENSYFSQISACTSDTCNAGAAITNASNTDCHANEINGLNVYDWNSSVTGGIQIGVPTSTSGHLYSTTLNGVVMFANTANNKGNGPAIYVRKVGTGKAQGVNINSPIINGSKNQGILVDGENVVISSPNIRNTIDSCIQFASGVDHAVNGGMTRGGSFGVITQNSAECDVKGLSIKAAGTAIYAYDTSTLRASNPIIVAPSVARFGKAAGATLDIAYSESNKICINSTAGTPTTGTVIDKFIVTDNAGNPRGYVPILNT